MEKVKTRGSISILKKKVTIIGVGMVSSATMMSLLNLGLIAETVARIVKAISFNEIEQQQLIQSGEGLKKTMREFNIIEKITGA